MSVTRQGKLDRIGPKLENAVKLGLIEGAQVVAQHAIELAPRLTGRLKRNISYGVPAKISPTTYKIQIGVNLEDAQTGEVGTNIEYAAIQEFGGTIDIPRIYARNKQALAFDWPNAPAGVKPSKSGKYVFRSVAGHSVTIPAQPYLRPALNESEPTIKALLAKNVASAFKN